MFPNLNAEMSRKRLSQHDLAKALGHRDSKGISLRMTGKVSWRYDETIIIKNLFFPNLSLEYLFYKGKPQNKVK